MWQTAKIGHTMSHQLFVGTNVKIITCEYLDIFFFFWSVEDFLKLIYAGLREKLNGDLRDQKINSQVCIQICPYYTLFLSTEPQTFCRQYRWVRDLLSSGSNPYRFKKNWMYEPDVVARIRALGLVNTKQSLSYFATEIIF